MKLNKISPLPIIHLGLFADFLRGRPFLWIRAQEIGDELPEVPAVLVAVESAHPSLPFEDGGDAGEEVFLIAVEGHDGPQGPHVGWSGVPLLLKH